MAAQEETREQLLVELSDARRRIAELEALLGEDRQAGRNLAASERRRPSGSAFGPESLVARLNLGYAIGRRGLQPDQDSMAWARYP